MTRPSSELAHLFRALKAPAAARALPKLADRARADEWSFEQFAAALLKTEVDSRDSHGGQGRIKAARFPARKTLEEFDFTLPDLDPPRAGAAPRPARLPRTAARTSSCSARPAPARPIWRSQSASAPAWPGTASRSAPPPNGSRCSPTRNATAASTTSSRGCSGSRCSIVDEVGYIPFDPQAANLMFMLVSPPLRTREPDRHQQQAVQRLGRDLRRRRRRRRDDRPARPPRRDPRPQGRLLPPQGPRPRPPTGRQNPRNGLTDHPRRTSPKPAERLYAPRTERERANGPRKRHSRHLRARARPADAGPASPHRSREGGQLSTGAKGSTFDRP